MTQGLSPTQSFQEIPDQTEPNPLSQKYQIPLSHASIPGGETLRNPYITLWDKIGEKNFICISFSPGKKELQRETRINFGINTGANTIELDGNIASIQETKGSERKIAFIELDKNAPALAECLSYLNSLRISEKTEMGDDTAKQSKLGRLANTITSVAAAIAIASGIYHSKTPENPKDGVTSVKSVNVKEKRIIVQDNSSKLSLDPQNQASCSPLIGGSGQNENGTDSGQKSPEKCEPQKKYQE